MSKRKKAAKKAAKKTTVKKRAARGRAGSRKTATKVPVAPAATVAEKGVIKQRLSAEPPLAGSKMLITGSPGRT